MEVIQSVLQKLANLGRGICHGRLDTLSTIGLRSLLGGNREFVGQCNVLTYDVSLVVIGFLVKGR